MNVWTFDLAHEANPIKRLGIHGLWRLLTYGSGQYADYYPDVRQTATLRWELGDTWVKLYWTTVDDLNLLMGCQLGDFRRGVGVIPGYQPDPEKPGFYATARGHLGICGTYFFSKKGARRSESLTPPKDDPKDALLCAKEREKKEAKKAKKVALYEDIIRQYGEPVRKVDHIRAEYATDENPAAVEIKVSPHARSDQPPSLEVGKRGGLLTNTFGNVYHPAFAMWNEHSIQGQPQELFVVSFSCLSYVFTQATNGIVGLGVDLPTFSEANEKHRLWAADNGPKALLWTDGNSRTAAWFMSAVLDLPPRTYSVLAPDGQFLFFPDTPGLDLQKVYAAFGEAVLPRDKAGLIRCVSGIPTKMQTDKKTVRAFALDALVRNVEHNFAWYRDLEGVATVTRITPKRTTITGLYPREREVLRKITAVLENPMEKQISERMKGLFEALVQHYHKHFNLESKPNGWDLAREKARTFAIQTQLNRAFNRQTILSALSRIYEESGDVKKYVSFFTTEEYDWLLTRTAENPGEVRALLIFACEVRGSKKLKKTNTTETTSTETTSTETTSTEPASTEPASTELSYGGETAD